MSSIQHQLSIKASVQDVYKALSTAEGIRGWWSLDCDISEAVGGENELRFRKHGPLIAMRFQIEALEPDEQVLWSCTENANPLWVGTQLQFDLRASDEGTDLSMRHGSLQERDSMPYQRTVQGWQHFMESLKSYLETGTGSPWD